MLGRDGEKREFLADVRILFVGDVDDTKAEVHR